MREDYEKIIQLLKKKKKLEGKEALERVKVDELEHRKKKLTLEIKSLKAENDTLQKKIGEIPETNMELGEHVKSLVVQKRIPLKDFDEINEDFAKRQCKSKLKQGTRLWR